jgi:hypothetical protein
MAIKKAPQNFPLKIAVDTNATRRFEFINFLIKNKADFNLYLPTIVQMELGYYYLSHGMSWEFFLEEISKWGSILMPLDTVLLSKITSTAYANRSTLSFKEHFRDYVIGIQASSVAQQFITYNKDHFQWMQIPVLTPEEFIRSILSIH